MKAVLLKDFGAPENMYIGDCPLPSIGSQEILVKVAATALNRADTLQRKGVYPPPAGASTILGLEMAGEVVEVGAEVSRWKLGDRVCALLSGGAYAEYVNVHEAMAIAIPDDWTFVEAAAIPEVYLTAFQALSWIAQLKGGERVLIHAGASGVGTAAIQLSKAMGAEAMVTASGGKHDICLNLGAVKAIDYQNEDFAEVVLDYTEGKGVDVVIDFVAAPYFQQNLKVLRMEGRMVMLSFLGGTKVDQVNLVSILRKRLQITGSTLRARSLSYKIDLTKDFWAFAQSRV
ncbi:MAG: NAD(P)H-quinone oxidoreductase, partial [Bacteroidota bacterium]